MVMRTDLQGATSARAKTEKEMRRYWQLTRIVWAHASRDRDRAWRALAVRSKVLSRLGSETDGLMPTALRVLASEAASLDARTLLSIGLQPGGAGSL